MPTDSTIRSADLSNPPLVSVVIPIYNGLPFIVDTIESVRRQTYPHWELVICDNRSKDETLPTLQRYLAARPDSRIRLIIEQEHLPMAENWNRSLASARGELVKLLPSDDILLPSCLEIQVSLLRESPETGFVTSGKEVIDRDGKKLFSQSPLKSGIYDWDNLGIRSLRAVANLLGEPGGILFRRRLLETCGNYNGRYSYFVDIELLLRFLKISQACVWKDPLYQFRIHGSSASASSRRLWLSEYAQILHQYDDELKLSRKPWLKKYLSAKARFIVTCRALVFWAYARRSS